MSNKAFTRILLNCAYVLGFWLLCNGVLTCRPLVIAYGFFLVGAGRAGRMYEPPAKPSLKDLEQRSLKLEKEAGLKFTDGGFLQPGYHYPPAPAHKGGPGGSGVARILATGSEEILLSSRCSHCRRRMDLLHPSPNPSLCLDCSSARKFYPSGPWHESASPRLALERVTTTTQETGDTLRPFACMVCNQSTMIKASEGSLYLCQCCTSHLRNKVVKDVVAEALIQARNGV